MNANALRTWGIAVSAALMTGALVIALQPAPSAEAQSGGPVQLAQAPAQAAPISFLVRFTGSGPIARAQRQAARGDVQEAQRQLEIQLRRQQAFRGLCFDRFTTGATEVVLRTCAAIVPSERANQEARWLAELRAMRGVAYVDVNATATQQRAG